MTPKEKAIQLVEIFIEPTKVPNAKGIWIEDTDGAKQCALMAVNEIIASNPTMPARDVHENLCIDLISEAKDYWKQVKLEVKNL